jgi:hypothetical protein
VHQGVPFESEIMKKPNCFLALAAIAVFMQRVAAAQTAEPATRPMAPSVEYGAGTKVELVRLALQRPWEQRWCATNGKHASGYWDLSLARWRGKAYQSNQGHHQYITDVGLTPVLRFQADDRKGWYGEGGIGLHFLSELYDNDNARLSTRAQFGDHLGLGYVFAGGWDLGVKIQHFSNGGAKRPNSGVNFIVFNFARPM